MTKRKKTAWIILISFILAIVILAIYLFVPNVRYWTFWQEPLPTPPDVFLPRPDAIVCKTDGVRKWLSQDEIDVVYVELQILMSRFYYNDAYLMNYSNNVKTEYQLKNSWVEFKYKKRYQYTANEYIDKTFVYDGILLILEKNKTISVVPCDGARYVDIGFQLMKFHNGVRYFESVLHSCCVSDVYYDALTGEVILQ